MDASSTGRWLQVGRRFTMGVPRTTASPCMPSNAPPPFPPLSASAGPSEWGRQSRSLTAAYNLIQSGFTNIKVGARGRGRPGVEESSTEGVGKRVAEPSPEAGLSRDGDGGSSPLLLIALAPLVMMQVLQDGYGGWTKAEKDIEVD